MKGEEPLNGKPYQACFPKSVLEYNTGGITRRIVAIDDGAKEVIGYDEATKRQKEIQHTLTKKEVNILCYHHLTPASIYLLIR